MIMAVKTESKRRFRSTIRLLFKLVIAIPLRRTPIWVTHSTSRHHELAGT
jgi:hypothetical protein